MGLEQSKQKFLWVLGEADRGDTFTGEARRFVLPEGFEERIKEVGLLVREWAPQPEILAHSSTGGFLGDGSFENRLAREGVGETRGAVRPWATRRDEHVTSEMAENAVKTSMASADGDEMRKRAADFLTIY
ncbi:Isoflavone 7-O-glucosyltransferase 1 [Capsicum baccatum]|uniref:Isoflavone 7-O-glucosyltransferase 1 n=1 Tax=Capsicum baccatum TaxID=33114 RepID=A0A2G2XAZ2_CAPBA|nr:Isoflavone 7-O-glucosyltransferase 1 [Capsicum baccatum]